MKSSSGTFVVAVVFLFVAATTISGSPIAADERVTDAPALLGAKQCSWGPTYWCRNLTNAAGCGAVKHCIQTVWEKHTVTKDDDSVCQICLNMVQEARDTLRSNGTQADLKAVLEGSCLLIPLPVINRMCVQYVDDFIPQLVEMLASQMDPQAVCSVAGLCNNVAIDRMLAEQTVAEALPAKSPAAVLTCKQCNTIASIIEQKFRSTDRDRLLEGVLRQCGRLSSLSDACASLVLTHFNDLYAHVERHLSADGVCHLSGTCAGRYHRHDDDEEPMELEIRPMGAVGMVNVDDDIPCELCKQLVHHLKDLLIANTTQSEFKSVLEGLCKQTGKFKAECLSIVDQYYENIYNALLVDLNENEACTLIEICPRGVQSIVTPSGAIMPLLPVVQAQHLYVRITARPMARPEPLLDDASIAAAQLPIDRLLGAPNAGQLVEDGKFCMVCEYVAHYVQTALAQTQTEQEIKDYLKAECDKHVSLKLRPNCDAFIDTYGDALIALAIQQIDPSEICPRMFVCPAVREEAAEVLLDAVQINGQRDVNADKCPLCVFAVAQAVAAIKGDRSVANIKNVLEHLCSSLPGKIKAECQDFVETYTPELVRMLLDDFPPQTICANLKLCTVPPSGPQSEPQAPKPVFVLKRRNGDGDILTNEIPDSTFNGDMIESISLYTATPNCLLCEQLVKEVEKRVTNKKSRAQLKDALQHACAKMPKLEHKCDHLVDLYGDKIVDLIVGEFTPKQICRELGQCILGARIEIAQAPAEPKPIETKAIEAHDIGVKPQCSVCEAVVAQLEKQLGNHATQQEIEEALKNVCHTLPKSYADQCSVFIDKYSSLIFALVQSTPPKEICGKLELCDASGDRTVNDKQAIEAYDMPYMHGDSDSAECVICETVMEKLEDLLAENSTQGTIANTVSTVCKTLPKRYDAACSAFVQAYVARIVSMLDSTPPKNICGSLKLCGSRLLTDVQETKLEIVECAVCHSATMAMAKVLEDPKVQRSVEQVIDPTCNMLPGAYNDRCLAMIKTYGKSIMNIIAGSGELQSACTKIGMCYPNEYRSFVQITRD